MEVGKVMADIRETVLLDHMDTSRFRKKPSKRAASKIKLALRRFVVASSGTPLRYIYYAIYRLHVFYALKALKRFPGIHSIYITGGMAVDEVTPGISDIDLTVNGTWTEQEQTLLIARLKRLGESSPLYDTLLSQCTQSLETLKSLYATDFYFQYLFDRGRTRWRRLYGEDVFAMLPPVPETRVGGGYYMELRTWWCYFIKSAFGNGPTATDELFRISIPYKAVAGILMTKAYFDGDRPAMSRRLMMQRALERSAGLEHSLLERLTASAKSHHRHFDGDIRQETFEYLLLQMERLHAVLGENASFQSTGAQGFHIEGSASEMMISKACREYVTSIVDIVKESWTGYRSAYLVPCLSFFYPDDLVLLLEVQPDQLPNVSQIRNLCDYALKHGGGLTQRVALYLLLPEAAYQLEIVSVVELWHHTLCRQANPEIFALLQRPEFVIDGHARSDSPAPYWSRFADALVNEEIGIRRSAIGKVAEAPDTSSLELLRNLWRHLQLEIAQRSAAYGFVVLAMTLPAMQRMLQHFGIPSGPVFDQLREAYESELNGQRIELAPLMSQVMELFAAFAPDTLNTQS